MFLADSPKLMAAIRQAAEQRDGKALASSAHALKGSIGLFAQQDAYQTARRLERTATSGDLAGVQDACATLEREMAEPARTARRSSETVAASGRSEDRPLPKTSVMFASVRGGGLYASVGDGLQAVPLELR